MGHALRTGLLLLAGCLPWLVVGAAPPPSPPASGQVFVRWTDDFAARVSTRTFLRADPTPGARPVVLSDAEGRRLFSLPRVPRPQAPAGTSRAAGGRAVAQSSSSPWPMFGAQPWVTILVRFADSTDATPHPREWYEHIMADVDRWYQEVSYGQMSLAGSKVVGWVNLPRRKADYTTAAGIGDPNMVEAAIALADAEVYFPDYYGIQLICNEDRVPPHGGVGGGPGWWTTIDGVTKPYAGTTIFSMDEGIVIHELGHGYWLDHAADQYGDEYGSPYDTMGHGGVHFNAYHKRILGWIPDSREYLAGPGTSQTITLERLAQPQSSTNYLCARIPIRGAARSYYTVEARQRVGRDANLLHEGVVVCRVDDSTANQGQSQVVDSDGNGNHDDDGTIWVTGETFTDAANGISVAVGACTGSAWQVTITNGSYTAPNTVTNTNDTGPGSLRNALNWAAKYPGTTIRFAIPTSDPGYGGGVWTIRPASPLREVSLDSSVPCDGTMIDGTTQPGYAGSPLIVLDGSVLSGWYYGLKITGANCTVRGLTINNFVALGICLSGAGATGNRVEGCWIGLDRTGTAAAANQCGGLGIESGSHGNTIGGTTGAARNVISGNAREGLYLNGSADNVVQGNYIGTNAAGTAAVGNAWAGLSVYGGSTNNTFGGSGAGQGNLLAGGQSMGLYLGGSGTTRNVVSGNTIGTNLAGTAALANAGAGVVIGSGAAANTLSANLISGNGREGVLVADAGSDANVITGNTIGVNLAGSAALANLYSGVAIVTGAKANVVTGNQLSGNGGPGVYLGGASASGNTVAGNRIGTNAAGSAAVGNGSRGVEIGSGASGNTIGGATAAARNIIAGNGAEGVILSGSGTLGNVVQGNYIGTNAAGTGALGNAYSGVLICWGACANTVSGNVISGGREKGVGIGGLGTSNNLVTGNLIGVDATAVVALPNAGDGVVIADRASNNTIGGTSPGARNVIAGNTACGICLYDAGTSGNAVLGNAIGTSASGSVSLPNGLDGIAVGAASGNRLGGVAPGEGNRIAYSGRNGVQMWDTQAVGNTIRGNAIHASTNRAINLAGGSEPSFWVTTNDTGDADTGPNNLQNHPVLSSVTLTGGVPTISGTLNSTANRGFVLDFYANDAADDSGYGEGQVWIGSLDVTTDGSGNAGFAFTPTLSAGGGVFSATATDKTTGDTSEFGNTVSASVAAPDLSIKQTAEPASAYALDGVCQAVPAGDQIETQSVAAGTTATYDVQVRNRGNTPGSFVVKVSETSESGWTVVYTSGATDISAGVRGGGWSTGSLAAGASTVVTIAMTPDASVAEGATRSATLVVYQFGGDPCARDAVQTVTRRTPGSYAIAGTAKTAGGSAIVGATVTAGAATTTTDAAGKYAFSGLAPGTYSVVVSAAEYTFAPISTSVTLGPSRNGVSFTGTVQTYTLGGTVKTAAGVPVSGVTVSTGTANATTDAAGAFTLAGLPAGAYTLTPTKAEYSFAPLSRSLTVGPSQTTISFTGQQATYYVDGTLKTAAGKALVGVSVTVGSTATTTNADGYYIVAGLTAGSYTVTPTSSSQTFTPASANVSVGPSRPGTDFTAGATPFSISGTVTFGGGGLAGVLVSVAGTAATTAADGGYTLSGLSAGSYTVTPWKSGYTFSPASSAVTLSPSRTGVGFAASRSTYTVSGTARTATGTALAGVSIWTDGASATTDASGAFTLSGLPAGSYGLLASKSGYVFTPVVLSVTVGPSASGACFVGAVDSGGSWVVTNTNDTGAGSLREALNYANLNPGTTIRFAIPTSDPNYAGGAWTIRPASALPTITASGTAVEAVTQPGYAGAPVVAIDGATSTWCHGLVVNAADCVVRGLRLGNCQGAGILVTGTAAARALVQGCWIGCDQTGASAAPNGWNGLTIEAGATDTLIGGTSALARNVISGNVYEGIAIRNPSTTRTVVQGNYIGTTPSGAAALANGHGVNLYDNPTVTTIGGNVISGNRYQGFVAAGSGITGTVIQGNRIGTDPTGTVAVANGDNGIYLYSGVHDSTIGGSAAGAGNQIAGNGGDGITMGQAGTSNNVIQGNLIGTNATGSAALGNGRRGVIVWGGTSGNRIGGTVAGAGNVISGNGYEGIALADAGTSGNRIEGNTIGTDASGAAAVRNAYAGIALWNAASANAIGGTTAGAGNLVSANGGSGIYLGGAGTDGNTIQGNTIGLNRAGTSALGNAAYGIEVASGAANTVIGGTSAAARNLIGANAYHGVAIWASAGTLVQGNYCGTNAAGTAALGNGYGGVGVWAGSTNTTIGGTAPGAGNLLSGNGAGIGVSDSTTQGTLIQGNRIGTDKDGSVALPNLAEGIALTNSTHDNTVGGASAAARNLISGNRSHGLCLWGPDATNNVIQGNYIGTDATGTQALPNGTGNSQAAIAFWWGPHGNTIGGSAAGAGNLISGNRGCGIQLERTETTGNSILGNTIGLSSTGGPLGNGLWGVYLKDGARQNTIGGSAAGAGNRIAYNALEGVLLWREITFGNAIRGNAIWGNGLLGINLYQNGNSERGDDPRGVTLNDARDGDTGPNNWQNYPVLTAATLSGGTVTITGTLNSTPGRSFALDFFANTAADPSGHGQGEVYLGSTDVTTDGNGDASFSFNGAAASDRLCFTATATDKTTGDTSEFSASLAALAVVASPSAVSVPEGGSASFAVTLNRAPTSNVTVSVARAGGDGDLSVSGGASLTFTPTNWSVAQTVTLAAAEDADAIAGSATFRASATGCAAADVTATEVDNDQRLVVTPSTVTVTEGTTATGAFTVKLAGQPAGSVTVTIAGGTGTGEDTDLTASVASVVLTSANWSTGVGVDLSAAQDADATDGSRTFTCSASGWASASVTATEADDDRRLVVAPAAVTVPEGATAAVGVHLAGQPAGNVTVTVARVSGDADLTVAAGATVTFTSANWATDQTVTLAAAQDTDAVADSATFRASATGWQAADVTATEGEDDQRIVVTPATVSVPEGTTAVGAFTVKLAGQPASDVTVTITGGTGAGQDADLTTGVGSVVLTRTNWSTGVAVNVSAAVDADAIEGTRTFTCAATGWTSATLTATEVEDDKALLVSPASVVVPEGTTLATAVVVRLAAQPAGDVTVTITGGTGAGQDTDLTTTALSVVLTPANWSSGVALGVRAAEDTDITEGTRTFTVSAPGWTSTTFTAGEADNDKRLLVTTNAVTVDEGGTATFGVRLGGPPAGDVTVTVARLSGDPDLALVGSATLSFSAANWNVPQYLTVSAAQDTDAASEQAVFRASASGWTPADVTATATDRRGLTLSASPAGESPTDLPLAITGTATGFAQPQYKLWIIGPHSGSGSSWLALGSYSTLRTFTWTPTVAGTYELRLWARETGSTAQYELSVSLAHRVSTNPQKLVVTSSPTGGGVLGQSVTITGSATGFTRPQYKLWIIGPHNGTTSTWVTMGSYSDTRTFVWVPPAVGTFEFQMWVREYGSTSQKDLSKSLTYAVAATALNVTVSPAAQCNKGETVTVTGTATGFTRPQYKLWIIGPHNGGPTTWLTLGSYGDKRSFDWTPNTGGTYEFQMWVREYGSTNQKDLAKSTGYFVYSPASNLTVTASPAGQCAVGQPVTITLAVLGGIHPQYKLWIIGPHNGGPTTWLTLGSYGDKRIFTWTPSTPGAYQFQAWVRELGSTAQKELVTTLGYQVTPKVGTQAPCPDM